MSDMVKVTYGGPSGALIAEGHTVERGGVAEWPREVAERVVKHLPDHALSIVEEVVEKATRKKATPEPDTPQAEAETAPVAGSAGSNPDLSEPDSTTPG